MVNYPKDWEITTLSNLPIQIKKGDLITEKTVQKGKYPVIAGGKTPAYYCDKYNRDGLTITVSASGASAGYVSLHEGRIFASDCSTISKSNAYDVRYIYYLLLKEQKQIYSSQTGGAQPHIHPRDIQNISVVYAHDVKEQQAIADALTAFDTHINNLAKLIEKKKMIRDGTVEDLVSGKRRLAGFSGKWEEISFNDSVIPKARIGWQGLKKDEYLQSGYSYLISGTDFYRGTISFEEISYVSKDRYDMDSNIQVKSGDVLVTKDGTIGKVAIVPNIDKRATLNSGVFVFRVIEKIKRKFLYWILRSSLFSNFIDELSAGSTIKHLYQKDLKQLKFVIPTSLSEQQAIADILTSMDKEISDLEEEKEKYIALKAGAMDDLLTGKIRLV